MTSKKTAPEREKDAARRAFLKKAAKLGAVTPAAVALVLAAGTKNSHGGDY